jgi:hypothetical protein
MTIPNCKDCKHFKETYGAVTYAFGGYCALTRNTSPRVYGDLWIAAAAFRLSGDCGPEGKYFEHKEAP